MVQYVVRCMCLNHGCGSAQLKCGSGSSFLLSRGSGSSKVRVKRLLFFFLGSKTSSYLDSVRSWIARYTGTVQYGPDPQSRLQMTIFVYVDLQAPYKKSFYKSTFISEKIYLLIIHELTKAQPGQNQNVLAGTGLMGTCELRISSQ